MEKFQKEGRFAKILDTDIIISKVNMTIMSKWINDKVTELLEIEDEIFVNMIIELLSNQTCGKKLQLEITGFLGKKTGMYCRCYI
jgi:serine/arginine repetitive matrix protein 1